jgi:replicative superfamily II helicase
MSKKKGKFDLTKLVHDGFLSEGQVLHFVSNPKFTCVVQKQPNNEYKVKTEEGTTTLHAFAQKCLGQEPPNHATCWFANDKEKTVYELWQISEEAEAA